ncbi:MAG TPA: protein-methionine-sulfoxide reductase catalytic subunit MsrP [Vicinamibacterales bacterium]|jgi:sulfoxide reductase catalytic subunit YedY
MLIKPASDIPSSEITDKKVYLNRRQFIQAAAGTVAVAAAGTIGAPYASAATPAVHGRKFEGVTKSPLSTTERLNSWEQITTYNNFYEFGIDKDLPSENAKKFKTDNWTVAVDGEVDKKANWTIEDILKGETLEERIYRHRCVEGWSMVIPWVGIPLANFIKRVEPTSKAKYIKFTSLADSRQMNGLGSRVLDWPYVEGLRMDEAMHPLTLLVVGLYGEVVPNQNGAPLRLAVPWKYGFKHGKSIVKITFTEKQPLNTWQQQAPSEYGFYANVNPTVDHPRWSQATERRIGEFLRRKTLMFNGYDQVASLYSGMDLRRNY